MRQRAIAVLLTGWIIAGCGEPGVQTDIEPQSEKRSVDESPLKAVKSNTSLKELERQLHSRDLAIQLAAIAELKSHGKNALPVLISCLQQFHRGSRYEDLRKEVAVQLRRIGSPAIGPLVHEATNSEERYSASEALALFGAAAMPEMAKAYRSGNLQQRDRVISWMPQFGSAAVPLLAEALSDEESDIVRGAADMIRHVGPAATYAIPALARLGEGDDPELVLLAAQTLEKINADSKILVPIALRSIELNEEDDFRFRYTCDILRRMGPDAIEALPALLKRVDDGRGDEDSVAAIETIGVDHTDLVVPVMVRYIGTGRADDNAVNILLANTEMIDPHFPTLINGMRRHSGEDTASRMMISLGRQSVSHLIKALREHPSPEVRIAITGTLPRMGPEAAEARPVFVEVALNDQDDEVIRAAVDRMHSFGCDARLAVPALIKLIDHKNLSVRSDVFAALEAYQLEAKSAIEPLKRAYVDKNNQYQKKGIAAAIKQLGGEPPDEKK